MPQLTFRQQVEAEIAKTRKKHGGSNSLHEGFGLLLEELAEFWEGVTEKPSKRNLRKTKHELVQLAALSEIIAEDNC